MQARATSPSSVKRRSLNNASIDGSFAGDVVRSGLKGSTGDVAEPIDITDLVESAGERSEMLVKLVLLPKRWLISGVRGVPASSGREYLWTPPEDEANSKDLDLRLGGGLESWWLSPRGSRWLLKMLRQRYSASASGSW